MEFCTEGDRKHRLEGVQLPGGVRRGFTEKRTFQLVLEGSVRICQAEKEGCRFQAEGKAQVKAQKLRKGVSIK